MKTTIMTKPMFTNIFVAIPVWAWFVKFAKKQQLKIKH